MTPVRAACAQLDVTRSPEQNLAELDRLAGVGDVDLLVVPELCTTGYLFADRRAVEAVAEPLDGPSVASLCGLSQRLGAVVVAGIAERAGDAVFNTTVIVAGGDLAGSQRKGHLSRHEAPLFDPGGAPEVIETEVGVLGCLSCFDLWFPERARILARHGAQVLCSPSAFGAPMTRHLARSRAIENHVHVLLANRIGTEVLGEVTATFRGESAIFDPRGGTAAAADGSEGTCAAEIRPSEADHKGGLIVDDLRSHYERYRVEVADGGAHPTTG